MKSFKILLFALFVNCAYSQEPTNSYAKQAYTALNTSLAKLKTLDPGLFSYQAEIDKAKKKIETIKHYEAEFDLTGKESELQEYINRKNSSGSSNTKPNNTSEGAVNNSTINSSNAEETDREGAIQDANLLYKELESLFKAPAEHDFELRTSVLAPDAQSRLDEFGFQTKTFIDNGGAMRVKNAKEIHRYREPKCILMEKMGYENRLKELVNATKGHRNADVALMSYYTIKKYEYYWNTLEVLTPTDQQIVTNASLTRKASAELLTPDQIREATAKNDLAFMTNVEMPDAIRKDAALETVFKNNFIANGWKETILKIHLLDSDWHIERNAWTGVILGRYQSAAIAVKPESGDCVYYIYTIIQDYNGSSYQSTSRRYSYTPFRILCEKVQ